MESVRLMGIMYLREPIILRLQQITGSLYKIITINPPFQEPGAPNPSLSFAASAGNVQETCSNAANDPVSWSSPTGPAHAGVSTVSPS